MTSAGTSIFSRSGVESLRSIIAVTAAFTRSGVFPMISVAHVCHEVEPISLRRRTEQLRYHLRRDRLDPFAADLIDHLLAVFAALLVIGARARRDEAHRADVAGRALQNLEEYIPAHRAPDDDGARDVEMVEQIDNVAGEIRHADTGFPAQVRRDRAPPIG